MTGSSSIRLRKPLPSQLTSDEDGAAGPSTSTQGLPEQQRQQRIIAPTPLRSVALRLGSASDSSDDEEIELPVRPASTPAGSNALTSRRSTTPALPPPHPGQLSAAQSHLEQRRQRAQDEARMAHARRILDREIELGPGRRSASPRILTHLPHLHSHHHRSHHDERRRDTDGVHHSVVATISARHRKAAERKEALRRQKRLKRFRDLDLLGDANSIDKRVRDEEARKATERELALSLPGRISADVGAADEHHNWEVVDTLDVVDPGVATVSALTNVANSIVFPYLPTFFNLMPVVDLPLETPADLRSSLSSDTRPLKVQAPVPWSQKLRRRLSRRKAQAVAAQGLRQLEEVRVDTGASGQPTQSAQRSSKDDRQRKAHRRVKEEERRRNALRDPLDTHVETLLAQRKRAQLKRVLKGLWAFLKTPQGIIVGIYGFLVVFCGAALVIFLLGWIDHGKNKDFWVEVFSQAVNGLFTITGVGLIPWRVRDTWRMGQICYYQHLIWRLRKKAHLPPLQDKNDLPDSLAPAPELEERRKQDAKDAVSSEPLTPIDSKVDMYRAASAGSTGSQVVPMRTGTPLQTIPESKSAASGLVYDPQHDVTADVPSNGPSLRPKDLVSRVRSPPIARTLSPFGRKRAASPVPREETASPTLAAAGGPVVGGRATSITWEPLDHRAPGGPSGHFVERPVPGATPMPTHLVQQHHLRPILRPGSAPPAASGFGAGGGSSGGPRISPTSEVAVPANAVASALAAGGAPLGAAPSRTSFESYGSAGAGYFVPERASLDGGYAGSLKSTPGRSTAHLSQYYSDEEPAVLQDWQVLSPQQAHRLHMLQTQFAQGASWYRPHETPTHRAFPIKMALWITILNDGNSLFQCMLCGVMWGFATHYKDRPAWTTGTLIPCSFLCGIGAAVLIAMGSKKTKKTDEVEERLRAAFAERERAYQERKKRLEAEESEKSEEDLEEDAGVGGGFADGDEDGHSQAVSALEAIVTGSEPPPTSVPQPKLASLPAQSPSPSLPRPPPTLDDISRPSPFRPSPLRPIAQRGAVPALAVSDDEEDAEDDAKDALSGDDGKDKEGGAAGGAAQSSPPRRGGHAWTAKMNRLAKNGLPSLRPPWTAGGARARVPTRTVRLRILSSGRNVNADTHAHAHAHAQRQEAKWQNGIRGWGGS